MKGKGLFLAAFLMTLTACQGGVKNIQSLQQPGYVLSGDNVASGFRRNALTIFDAQTWKIHHQVSLPHSWAKNFSRDPQGRLWIGFSGNSSKSDNLLHIYSPDGKLIKTMRPCVDPEAGISFAAGKAFIACAERGFSGKVVAVNLETLAVEKTIELSLPDRNLLLISSAASEQAVVVFGSSVITLIDPRSLTVRAQVNLGDNTDIWRIIPNKDRFYLLNVGSWQQPRTQANDILVLEPSNPPKITRRTLAASPLWGAIEGDILYSYHNPTWNQPNSDTKRFVSRLELSTGKVQTWSLPNEWDASDLAVINGKVVLAKWHGAGGSQDGIYQFDLVSGRLIKQVLTVADASQLLVQF